jgi:hypothetical protein
MFLDTQKIKITDLKNSKFTDLKNPSNVFGLKTAVYLLLHFDLQALGEATSHPERLYLPTSSYDIFVCLDLDPDVQPQINPYPGSQL